MPTYVVYDPSSAPVSNMVASVLYSFDQGREAELGANFVRDPTLAGVNAGQQMRWNGSAVVNLTQEQIDSIESAKSEANLVSVKTAAKNIFITPSGSYQQALRLAFVAFMVDMYLPEANARRADHGQPQVTANQLQNAFKSAYEARIDALSSP